MIEEVEEFRPKLDLLRLANLEVLLQNEVEVNQVGAAEVADPGIAKAVCGLLARCQRRGDKCCLVEPAIKRLVAGSGTAKVCPLGCGIEGEVVGVGDLV